MANEAERRRWNDEIWARGWFRREALTDQVTPFLLEAAQLQAGEHVLDIGCGGGRTSLAAARAVGPRGAVLGVDISEPILAVARTRAEASGLGNVSFAVADAQSERLGRDGLDVAISQFGVMFFDESVTAFANIARHVRSGGRLAFACWQPLDRNPWFPGPAMAPFTPPPPPPAEGKNMTGPFTLGDTVHVHRILDAAGWSDVAIAPHDLVVEVPGETIGDDEQLVFQGVQPERMDEARTALREHLAQFPSAGNGRYHFPLAFQVVTARRP